MSFNNQLRDLILIRSVLLESLKSTYAKKLSNAKFSDATDFYKCEIKNCKYDKGLDVSNFKDFIK